MKTVHGQIFPYPIVLPIDKIIVDNNKQIDLVDNTN